MATNSSEFGLCGYYFGGSGPEVIKRQRVTKERAALRIRSWTVQNEMRGVLDECPQVLQEELSILQEGFLEERRMEGEKKSVLLSIGEKRIGRS